MFTLKRVDHTPQAEVEQLNSLKYNYRAHFNAITQYLYEVSECHKVYMARKLLDFCPAKCDIDP